LAISLNIMRERSALSPMDSNSGGDLRAGPAAGGGLDCASATDGAAIPQQITKTANATERTGISALIIV
jgi:hypothetical protein